MSKITLDNLSDNLKAYLEGLGLSEEQVLNLINENGLNEEELKAMLKDTMSINELNTNSKTVIGAINELFQSANNGKELIASAIGEPLDSNDTFSAMSNDINSLLSTFKTNMMNSGVVVESGDKFKSLIDKIKGLTEGEGNRGIQYASGYVTYDTSIRTTYALGNYRCYKLNISGIGFKPDMCCIRACSGATTTHIHYNTAYCDNYYFGMYSYGSEGILYGSSTSDFYSYEDGIYMPISTYSNSQYEYFIVGVGEEDTTLRDSLASILQEEGVNVTEEDDMASLISKVDSEFNDKNNEINILETELENNKGLDIISATELPSEVVNNRIVLISNIDPASVEIKDNSLCNPSVEGMVNVGTTSTNNGKYCTITKDNITVLLYLIRALQYVNGSVKQLSAYVGIDGSWVQFSWAGLYAFISGAYENSNLFGTFTNAATSSTLYSAYPPEITGNTVKIGQTSSSRSYDDSEYYKGNALYYFSTKINCSNYSKLKVTITNYEKTNVQSGYIHFGIMSSVTDDFSSSTDKFIEIKNTGTYEVDLSSYNNRGYIAFYIFSNSYSTTKICHAYVYISSIELMP